MTDETLKYKVIKNLDKIVILGEHPRLGYKCDWVADCIRVCFMDITGRVISSSYYALKDYGRLWTFKEDDDSAADLPFDGQEITAAELVEISKKATDEKRKILTLAVDECVEDILAEVSQNIRTEALKGNFKYKSCTNIKAKRYLHEKSLIDEFKFEFEDMVFEQLKTYYESKGFKVSFDNEFAETIVLVLDWSETKPDDKEDFDFKAGSPLLQTDEDLNKLMEAYGKITTEPKDYPFVYYYSSDDGE